MRIVDAMKTGQMLNRISACGHSVILWADARDGVTYWCCRVLPREFAGDVFHAPGVIEARAETRKEAIRDAFERFVDMMKAEARRLEGQIDNIYCALWGAR